MSITGDLSDRVTQASWDVSNKITEETEAASEFMDRASQETSEILEKVTTEAASAMSVVGNVARALKEDEDKPMSIAEERFLLYGDPEEDIKKKAEEERRHREHENPYDYPKALRKYL